VLDLLPDKRGLKFLEGFRGNHVIGDWKVQQAARTIKIYLNNYFNDNVSVGYPEERKRISEII
jgi:hypothetical protein